jgi:hypothetical protein
MFGDLLNNENLKYLLVVAIIILILSYSWKSEKWTTNVSEDGKCGPNNNDKMCPRGKVCSDKGECGDYGKVVGGHNSFYDGIPGDYEKCAEEGEYCIHYGDNNIYYGEEGKRMARIPSGDVPAGFFSCLSMNHEQYRMPNAPLVDFPVMPVYDPAPGKQKSCWIKK